MSDTRPAPATVAPHGDASPVAGDVVPAPDLTADHLPCGRSTDDLLDLVLDGRAAPPHDKRDAHQRTCVHCLALAAEADQLWAPVRAAAGAVPAPPDLLASVMASVRQLGRDPLHLVIAGTRGATRISAEVIRLIAESAAADVPDVALALARRARPEPAAAAPPATTGTHIDADVADIAPVVDPEVVTEDVASTRDLTQTAEVTGMTVGDGIGISGQHTVIDLVVITTYGAVIPVVASRVRGRVREALQMMTTATDVRVDIYVDDVAVGSS